MSMKHVLLGAALPVVLVLAPIGWSGTSLDALRERAMAGDEIAQRELGHRLLASIDTASDVTTGIRWLEQAVDRGDTEAAWLLAQHFRQQADRVDDRQGPLRQQWLAWLRKATLAGHADATLELAEWLIERADAPGVASASAEQSRQDGETLLRHVADAGHAPARRVLANRLADGRGLKRDVLAAAAYRSTPAPNTVANAGTAASNPRIHTKPAPTSPNGMTTDGSNPPEPAMQADTLTPRVVALEKELIAMRERQKQWIKKATHREQRLASLEKAFHASRKQEAVPLVVAATAAPAPKQPEPSANDTKHARGLEALSAGDYPKARLWFERAAKRGHNGARNNLGLMQLRGLGGAKDVLSGLAHLRVAAEAGSLPATESLATAYQFGVGVIADRRRATEYWRHAAQRGSTRAGAQLVLLGEAPQAASAMVMQ